MKPVPLRTGALPPPCSPSIGRRPLLVLMAGGLAGIAGRAAEAAAPAAVDDRVRVKVLHAFGGMPRPRFDGRFPACGVIRAADGLAYGTTEFGGKFGFGTVYRMIDARELQIVYAFGRAPDDGARPTAKLLQASDGAFWGTTSYGHGSGPYNGTVFRLDPAGTLATLHVFQGNDGSGPRGALLQAADGRLYGTTAAGGPESAGTVFRIALDGRFELLHTFAFDADGGSPNGLVQGADGWLYGTAGRGGGVDKGTIFRVSTAGAFEVVHRFAGPDGAVPRAPLTPVADGTFYGTTQFGGSANDGTIFRFEPAGTVTQLFSFDRNRSEGALPIAPLTLGSDGRLYGTAGGTLALSTVFRLDARGRPRVLHTFPAYWSPDGELLEWQPGVLIGTLQDGGGGSGGGVYRLLDRRQLPAAG